MNLKQYAKVNNELDAIEPERKQTWRRVRKFETTPIIEAPVNIPSVRNGDVFAAISLTEYEELYLVCNSKLTGL